MSLELILCFEKVYVWNQVEGYVLICSVSLRSYFLDCFSFWVGWFLCSIVCSFCKVFLGSKMKTYYWGILTFLHPFPWSGVHPFVIPWKDNLKILTSKFNLHVKGSIYSVTGLVFSINKLRLLAARKGSYSSCSTNAKAPKMMKL